MKEFPRLNLTIEQLKELRTLHEHSQWECLCTTIEHRELRECLDEIRRVLGGHVVRLDEHMLGRSLAGDDARQLRLDWLDHEIARQRRDTPPEPPEGFEYLDRGPVDLSSYESATKIAYYSRAAGKWIVSTVGDVSGETRLHYAVKRKLKKLGPWHVKETFGAGNKFEHAEGTYTLCMVGPSIKDLFFQLISSRGTRWNNHTVKADNTALTAKEVAHLMYPSPDEFTYVEK